MAIGGAEDKVKERHILTTFLGMAGAEQARIAVLPAASSRADEVGELYHALFRDLGAPVVEVVHVYSRLEAQDSARLAILEEASGIFMTGGDQLRLATLLGGTAMAQTIRRRNADGIVVAGTSAGASILGQHMIAFGRAGEVPEQRMVQLAPGLGLTNRVIIDQHFQQRGRTGRLMVAVAYNPFLIGLGIDEDTAAVLNPNNVLEVVGRGSVIVVDGAGMTYTNVNEVKRHEPVALTDMRLHVLTNGFRYNLIERRPEIPDVAP
jgi:cyanophycinase